MGQSFHTLQSKIKHDRFLVHTLDIGLSCFRKPIRYGSIFPAGEPCFLAYVEISIGPHGIVTLVFFGHTLWWRRKISSSIVLRLLFQECELAFAFV